MKKATFIACFIVLFVSLCVAACIKMKQPIGLGIGRLLDGEGGTAIVEVYHGERKELRAFKNDDAASAWLASIRNDPKYNITFVSEALK